MRRSHPDGSARAGDECHWLFHGASGPTFVKMRIETVAAAAAPGKSLLVLRHVKLQ